MVTFRRPDGRATEVWRRLSYVRARNAAGLLKQLRHSLVLVALRHPGDPSQT
jgi:hypothetical protein